MTSKVTQDASSPRASSLLRKMVPSLSTIEITFYTALWIFGNLFSIYHVFLASSRYFRILSVHDLEVSWFGIGRWRKDVSDTEWRVTSQLLPHAIIFMSITLLGSQFLKKFNPQMVPIFHVFLGMIYIRNVVGLSVAVYLCVQPVVMFAVLQLGRSSVLYLASMCFIIFHRMGPLRLLHDSLVDVSDFDTEYLTSITYFWINSRCLSYCLDKLWGDVEDSAFGSSTLTEFLNLLAYAFYVPLAICGPIVNYKQFHKSMTSSYREWNRDRWQDLILSLVRYCFWFIFNNLILHALYFSAIQYDASIMQQLNLWTLSGIGLCMGLFFFLKYLVFYGLSLTFARHDDIDTPSLPVCTSSIHLYSDMWRSFDNGLYLFLRKYFYLTVLDKIGNRLLHRLFASATTFAFVYIWHAIQSNILVWTVLNFLGITLEAMARAMGSSDPVQRLERCYFSPRWRRRIYALLGAPLFLMSILSSFYFFMGLEMGNFFMKRTLAAWPIGLLVTLFFMYCGAQTSLEIKNWKIRAQLR